MQPLPKALLSTSELVLSCPERASQQNKVAMLVQFATSSAWRDIGEIYVGIFREMYVGGICRWYAKSADCVIR